jgi:hypothetical protein
MAVASNNAAAGWDRTSKPLRSDPARCSSRQKARRVAVSILRRRRVSARPPRGNQVHSLKSALYCKRCMKEHGNSGGLISLVYANGPSRIRRRRPCQKGV